MECEICRHAETPLTDQDSKRSAPPTRLETGSRDQNFVRPKVYGASNRHSHRFQGRIGSNCEVEVKFVDRRWEQKIMRRSRTLV